MLLRDWAIDWCEVLFGLILQVQR